MSSVDDILFAPIQLQIDFLVRRRRLTLPYDWKPNSVRAHDWCQMYYPSHYRAAQTTHDGWLENFCHTPGPPDNTTSDWADALRNGKFTFSE